MHKWGSPVTMKKFEHAPLPTAHPPSKAERTKRSPPRLLCLRQRLWTIWGNPAIMIIFLAIRYFLPGLCMTRTFTQFSPPLLYSLQSRYGAVASCKFTGRQLQLSWCGKILALRLPKILGTMCMARQRCTSRSLRLTGWCKLLICSAKASTTRVS